MKILVTGSKGQLGTELMIQGSERGHEMSGYDIPELDISDQKKISDIISNGHFDIVINAAAYTAVDMAETEHEKAENVNAKGPQYIAEECARTKTPLIHVSTDYVFNGSKIDPYTENDLPDPIGVYGTTKLKGEKAVQTALKHHIIVRTAWVYGTHGKNFVRTMLAIGKDREELRVVSDQTGCPTDSFDLAAALLTAAESVINDDKTDLWGTYHFCGAGKVTWHGFAEAIFEEARKYEEFKVRKIQAITTSEYPTLAKRPANSVLDCTKFSNSFKIRVPEWNQSLNRMIKRLYA